MFIGKQPKFPPTDAWINKIWYTQTIKCYSPLKKKEILAHTTTWMNLENIRINEISQTQKDNIV